MDNQIRIVAILSTRNEVVVKDAFAQRFLRAPARHDYKRIHVGRHKLPSGAVVTICVENGLGTVMSPGGKITAPKALFAIGIFTDLSTIGEN
jgi:hypothetical protein